MQFLGPPNVAQDILFKISSIISTNTEFATKIGHKLRGVADQARNTRYTLVQDNVIRYCQTSTIINKNLLKTEYKPSSIYTAYTIEICSLCRTLCGIS